MKLTAQTFEHVGVELFGPHWINPMSEALDVNRRTVERWANEEFTIPPNVFNELADLCEAHGKDLVKLAKELRR